VRGWYAKKFYKFIDNITINNTNLYITRTSHTDSAGIVIGYFIDNDETFLRVAMLTLSNNEPDRLYINPEWVDCELEDLMISTLHKEMSKSG
jgi:hypothetical protein